MFWEKIIHAQLLNVADDGFSWVVLNYETKSKRNERNETKYYATKYTKMRNETQRNEIY